MSGQIDPVNLSSNIGKSKRIYPHRENPCTIRRTPSKTSLTEALRYLHKEGFLAKKTPSEELLEYLARYKHPSLVRVQALIKEGAQLGRFDDNHMGALHHAVTKPQPDINIVKALLELPGLEINAQDNSGHTALMLSRSKAVTDTLLARGADMSIKTDSGKTALRLSIENLDQETCQSLIEANSPPLSGEESALNLAFDSYSSSLTVDPERTDKFIAIASYLIDDTEVDVDKSSSGFTPLYDSCNLAIKELVGKLLAAGADVNLLAPRGDGDLPRHSLLASSDPEIVRALLDKGAELTELSPEEVCFEETEEFFANEEILDILLEKDVKKINNRGDSLSHLAIQFANDGDFRLLKLLRSKLQFFIDKQNSSNMTPVSLIGNTLTWGKLREEADQTFVNDCVSQRWTRRMQRTEPPSMADFVADYNATSDEMKYHLALMNYRNGENVIVMIAKAIENRLNSALKNSRGIGGLQVPDELASFCSTLLEIVEVHQAQVETDPRDLRDIENQQTVYEILSQTNFKPIQRRSEIFRDLIAAFKPDSKGWFG